MRKLLIIAVLLGVMLALSFFKDERVGVGDSMTLAAIGFVVLAAFTIAEIGSALSLPRVTGYIVTGIALGPYAANILSREVVGEMKMFNTLALGLIATSAGLELDLGQIRKVGKTLAATILAKVLLGVALVAGALFGLNAVLPRLGLDGSGQIAAVALVMGVLSIATSPAIVLAVLSESGSKGRLSDLVLGAAVFKDLVVVVSLATAVAVAKVLVVPGASLDSSVFVHVAQELGGSIVAGVVLAGVLVAYLKFIRAEMLLFVAAMILVGAEVCRAFHLELLLVFITAGCVVRNFTHYEHDLLEPLEMVALPVFVVFFTNAGASVDLKTTWGILPLAFGLCATRALAYFISARIGARVGGESAAVRDNAWMAYLPQAGVALGLVGLAAGQLPAVSRPISSLGMAVVAVNLLIGPLTLRRALGSAGELPKEGDEPAGDETETASGSDAPPPSDAAPHPASSRAAPLNWDVVAKLAAAEARPSEEALRETLTALRVQLAKELQRFEREHLRPWVDRCIEDPGASESSGASASVVDHRTIAAGELFERSAGSLASLPEHVRAAADPAALEPHGEDGAGARFRKWRARAFGSKQRRVPVRLLARVTVEPTLAELSARAVRDWCEAHATLRVHLAARVREGSDPDGDAVRAELETWLDAWRLASWELVAEGLEQLAHHVSLAGTSALRSRDVRFSSVEPRVREALEGLGSESRARLASGIDAARGTLAVARALRAAESGVRESARRRVSEPVAAIREQLEPAFESLRQTVSEMTERARELDGDREQLRELMGQWRDDYSRRCEELLAEPGRSFRSTAVLHGVVSDVKGVVAELPDRARVVQHDESDAATLEMPRRTVLLRRLGEQHLVASLLPTLDDAIRSVSAALASAERRARDALQSGLTVLEGQIELGRAGPDRQRELVVDELERTEHRLDLARKRLLRALKESEQRIEDAVGAAVAELSAGARSRVAEAATAEASVLERMTAPLRAGYSQATGIARDLAARLRPAAAEDGSTHYDAAALRAHLDALRARTAEVPQKYARWFAGAPVRDERLFTAHRDQLARVIEAESAWANGRRPGAVLVVGSHGSGRTSLLNMCELELTAARMVRLEADDPTRPEGVIGAIAEHLGCRAHERVVRVALRSVQTAVILDDLEGWIGSGAAGLKALDDMLSLVTRSRDHTFWVVSIERNALAVYDDLARVRASFERVVDLDDLTAAEIASVIEARHKRSGLSIEYPTAGFGSMLGQLGGPTHGELFVRLLSGTNSAGLSGALAGWLRAVHIDDGVVRPDLKRLLPPADVLTASLEPEQIAVVSQVLRYGPLSVPAVANELRLSRATAERHVAYLDSAGILSRVAAGAAEFDVPRDVRDEVLRSLKNARAL